MRQQKKGDTTWFVLADNLRTQRGMEVNWTPTVPKRRFRVDLPKKRIRSKDRNRVKNSHNDGDRVVNSANNGSGKLDTLHAAHSGTRKF